MELNYEFDENVLLRTNVTARRESRDYTEKIYATATFLVLSNFLV